MIKKRICPMHGLWNKINKDDRCPLCKKSTAKVYDNTYRDKANDKFYHSKEWKQARYYQLMNYPFCISCSKIADTVDHIIAIKDGGDKLSNKNLQSMCKSCHNIKENKEGNRW